MNAISADDFYVYLTVDDARTAHVAGVTFARALSGADSADFVLALAEQEHLVARAIVEAGHHTEQAQLAAGHFATAALGEWARIISASSHGARGQA